jgi:hypothetical protein
LLSEFKPITILATSLGIALCLAGAAKADPSNFKPDPNVGVLNRNVRVENFFDPPDPIFYEQYGVPYGTPPYSKPPVQANENHGKKNYVDALPDKSCKIHSVPDAGGTAVLQSLSSGHLGLAYWKMKPLASNH